MGAYVFRKWVHMHINYTNFKKRQKPPAALFEPFFYYINQFSEKLSTWGEGALLPPTDFENPIFCNANWPPCPRPCKSIPRHFHYELASTPTVLKFIVWAWILPWWCPPIVLSLADMSYFFVQHKCAKATQNFVPEALLSFSKWWSTCPNR